MLPSFPSNSGNKWDERKSLDVSPTNLTGEIKIQKGVDSSYSQIIVRSWMLYNVYAHTHLHIFTVQFEGSDAGV